MYNRNRSILPFAIAGILVLALVLLGAALLTGGIPNIDLSNENTDENANVQVVDTDGDGIIDSRDNCPTDSGAMTNQGCPVGSNADNTGDTDGDNRVFERTVAGGDFFALGVEDLNGGWMRIREAGNRDYCAWSNQFKMEVSSGVAVQVPHCLEFRVTGTGSVLFTFRPDREGYATSDTLNSGLAWWPAGNNGSYRVRHGNGSWTSWIPLTTGPEGVNFPLNGGQVSIEFRLENGFVTMPLGEIRNNVQPAY